MRPEGSGRRGFSGRARDDQSARTRRSAASTPSPDIQVTSKRLRAVRMRDAVGSVAARTRSGRARTATVEARLKVPVGNSVRGEPGSNRATAARAARRAQHASRARSAAATEAAWRTASRRVGVLEHGRQTVRARLRARRGCPRATQAARNAADRSPARRCRSALRAHFAVEHEAPGCLRYTHSEMLFGATRCRGRSARAQASPATMRSRPVSGLMTMSDARFADVARTNGAEHCAPTSRRSSVGTMRRLASNSSAAVPAGWPPRWSRSRCPGAVLRSRGLLGAA